MEEWELGHYSYNFAGAQALADHAVNVVEGKSEMLDFDAVIDSLKANTPGAGWNGSYFVDRMVLKKRQLYINISRYLCIW